MDINEALLLRLSSYADYILNCDRGAFMNSSAQKSPFVNKVLLNYWAESRAMNEPTKKFDYQGSVQFRLQLNQDLSSELGDMIDLPINKKIFNFYSYNKKFSPAKFVAAILEEYAQLPFVAREQIFYKQIFEDLSSVIETNNSGNKKVVVCETSSGNDIEIYPVRICMDEWSTYNYLIGLVFDEDHQKLMPTSMRISRIKSVHTVRKKYYFSEISDINIALLDKALSECGVMFLSTQSKIVDAKIRFTAGGRNMYDNMYFLRPPYVNAENCDDGGCVMKFRCTERQILNYFRKFGKEAEIIYPTELREKFLSFYAKAYEMYSDNFMED